MSSDTAATDPNGDRDDTDAPPHRYTAALAAEIERRWQDRWEAEGTFAAPNPSGPLGDPDAVAGRPKLYVLDMFPYPSGAGLHVGHPLGYIATDVYGRYQRMTGHNVLHTLGYDAFGLPAEQYAVQTGQHPRTTTEANIVTMRRQLRRLGLAHDPRRSVATIDPDYYRWTQWIFLQIFNSWYDAEQDRARPIAELEAELAAGSRVDAGVAQAAGVEPGRPWAELADIERRKVVDAHRLAYLSRGAGQLVPRPGHGAGQRGGHRRRAAPSAATSRSSSATLRQWMMRITAYADRLLDDLDDLDWPESDQADAAQLDRPLRGRAGASSRRSPARLEVFTTRPDTLFGATYMVLAPEHPLVDELAAGAWPDGVPPRRGPAGTRRPREAVAAYRRATALRTEIERQTEGRDKTGVFTGGYATNPVNGERSRCSSPTTC